jgi:N5-(carboxyethyl)ornithine synthase
MITIVDINYCAVDHTTSYYWESYSRSLSAALTPHLPSVVEGRESWKKNKTISKAINVDQGIVLKNSILSF